MSLSADQTFRQGPPRPSSVLQPGLRALVPGEERYTVPGGGVIAVPVFAGDHLRVVDVEGMQACEIVTADAAGKVDLGILGARGDRDATGIKRALSSGSESARVARASLARRGIVLANARAVTLFGGASLPGVSAEFAVSRDGVLLVAAPAEPMEAGAQETPSRISASTVQRPRPISSAPANTSRSSTSPGANAPTSSVSQRGSSTRERNARST